MSVSQLLIVRYRIVLLTAFSGYMYVSGLYNHSKYVLNLGDSKILGKLVEKKAHRLYISSLIVLWMSLTSSFIFGWVESIDAFVIDNNSPVDVLAALETLTNDTPGVMVLVASVVSNGILVIDSWSYPSAYNNLIPSHRYGVAIYFGTRNGPCISLRRCFSHLLVRQHSDFQIAQMEKSLKHLSMQHIFYCPSKDPTCHNIGWGACLNLLRRNNNCRNRDSYTKNRSCHSE